MKTACFMYQIGSLVYCIQSRQQPFLFAWLKIIATSAIWSEKTPPQVDKKEITVIM